MKISELREKLDLFNDEDAQVVVGCDGSTWVKPMAVLTTAVNLGAVVERVVFIMVPELESESDDDCSRCKDLEDAIDAARSALDSA